MKRQNGFTLIEALVTMTVVAILVASAVPNFTTTIRNGRLSAQGNDLLGAFLFARSQAIAKNTAITVCVSDVNLASCTNSSNWENGWIVGVSNGSTGISGTPLRVHEALTGSNTLRNDATTPKLVVFGAGNGVLAASSTGLNINFRLCDTRGTSYARSIYLSLVGEARISPTAGKQIDGSTAISSCP